MTFDLFVTFFSVLGSWYAKKHNSPDVLVGIYVSMVLLCNIIAFKIASYDLGIVILTATAASIVYPVTFLMTDVVVECFGKAQAQRMIFIAFLAQVAAAVFIFLAINLTPASGWSEQGTFIRVLGFAPRLMLASWVAFLVSENVDVFLFSWLKRVTNGRHLWMRNIVSGLPAMALDTAIFVTIAFWGSQPLFPLMEGVLGVKWLVGFVNMPFMYLNRYVIYGKRMRA